MLGEQPHVVLQNMADKYGPIMQIRLGLVPTIVVSSPEYAELALKTHDLVFASRPNIESSEYLSYGRKGLVFAPYGSYWRNIRKLCTLHLLSHSKLELFKPMRRDELQHFIQSIKSGAQSRSAIDVTGKVGSLIEDMTYRMVFGFKDDRFNLKSSLQEVVKFGGVFNLGDYIPYIGALDLQGLRRRMRKLSKFLDEFMEKIINEHANETNGLQGTHRDFIDIMLSLMNSNNTKDEHLGRDNIKAILIEMLAAGMDTTTTVIEWTIAELLKNPRVMKLVQEELRDVVGLNRMVEEADLAKLKYMKMVIKESMRLHPVAPLLIHESIEDAKLDGYFIPSGSRIIINIYKIGRDPKVWSENANDFYPERFEGTAIDVLGHDFQLLPFGSGRRMCPGLQLGSTVAELVIAQLVHCFTLELPQGMPPLELDMSEKFGLTLPRANHLFAIPSYRLHT